MENLSRDLSVERLYAMGDFKNMRLTDTVKNIPYPLSINSIFIGKIRSLQLIEVELFYRKYFELIKQVNTYSVDEAMKFLESIRMDTLGEITAQFEDFEKQEK